MPASEVPIPRWMGRSLAWLLALLLVGGGVAIIALYLGAADPPLAGPLAWERLVPAGECLDVREMELPAVTFPASLVISAHVEMPPEALTRWGVWLGALDSDWRWEVLPPGYVIHAGQTLPFFHVGAGVNTLRLDLATGRYVLWLNEERALSGTLDRALREAWGLLDGGDVCWQRVAFYRPN